MKVGDLVRVNSKGMAHWVTKSTGPNPMGVIRHGKENDWVYQVMLTDGRTITVSPKRLKPVK